MSENNRVFSEKELVRKIHTVNDKMLGKIAFGDLTLEEGLQITDMEGLTERERALEMVFQMRKKVVPDLKKQDIKDLPLNVGTRLIEVLTKESGFLPQRPAKASESPNKQQTKSTNQSKRGSKPTKQHKQ